ncbi:hypothetical protein IFT73_04105 [Aeromicrobium sp. CFBP 8757]|uniref:hypothetical protein n=1 Tax=Aeromicrobium sp. CFBP 8757 TaxID=2775288 RepID=UPI001785F9F8|nr:hypothetical protein [Aeromicrobium sp. CFBP 8757]MBD8606027.1 hypothetical protein [Aeromicrobium sp. CFBP 8757]
MIQALLKVVTTMAPKLGKLAGPALAAWLAKPKNQQQAAQMLRGLGSLSAAERLKSKMELAEVTFEELANNERLPIEQREIARTNLAEVTVLKSRLALRSGSSKAQRANRAAVSARFDHLIQQLNEQL